MKKSKMLVSLLMALALLTALVGCQSKTEYSASIPLKDIAYNIQESQEFSMMGEQTDSEFLKEAHNIDTTLYKEYFILMPMRASTTTIAIMEANNAEDIDAIEQQWKAYQENLVKTFEQYMVEERDMAKKGQFIKRGNYAMFIIAPDVEEAIKMFEKNILTK